MQATRGRTCTGTAGLPSSPTTTPMCRSWWTAAPLPWRRPSTTLRRTSSPRRWAWDYRLDSEFTTAPLQKGDILLLCSDGLTNAVPREQLEQLLRTGRFYDLPDLLIRTANENGGPDNITALLLCVEEVR